MATKKSTSPSESPAHAKTSLTLLTWNINKGTFPKGVSSTGSAGRRNLLIPAVLKDLAKQLGKKPDVLLLQESTIVESSAKSIWELSEHYRQQFERSQLYQGIDMTLGEKEMDSLSKQIDKLVPEGTTDHKDALKRADKDAGFSDDIIVDDDKDRRLMRSDIPPRAFARKLEVSQNGTKIEVIVVSFHSVYKDEKKRYIKLFFNLMCRLAHVHKCPVLIGGDFNLPVGDWKWDIEQAFKCRVHVPETHQGLVCLVPVEAGSRADFNSLNVRDWKQGTERDYDSRVRVAKTYTRTPHRKDKDLIDTFAVVYPSDRKVECTLSTPIAVYPFPDDVTCDGQFKVVTFTDQKKEELKKLLLEKHHKTSQGEPDWSILKYDLDHDPVFVKVTLHLKD